MRIIRTNAILTDYVSMGMVVRYSSDIRIFELIYAPPPLTRVATMAVGSIEWPLSWQCSRFLEALVVSLK